MSITDTEARTGAAETGRRGWRFGLGALAFVLVAGLLVGFAVGVLTLRPSTPADTSPEAGFARDMESHHAQAVEMGMIAYDRAESDSVRQLGYDIALGQQTEIGRMRQWLREWDLLATGPEPPMAWMPDEGAEFVLQDGLMPGMATQEQMAQLRQAEGAEVDRLFLDLMIYHHLGGVHMLDAVLELSDHPDVTWLAGMAKDKHHRELEVLRDLQTQVEAAG